MSDRTILEDQIRDCFGRVLYTFKTQAKAADRCARTLRLYKIFQIVLAAITSSGIIALVFFDALLLKILTALFSIISLYITGYMKGFDPGGTAQKHRDAASSLWSIRESYLSLLTDIRGGMISTDQARQTRDSLQTELGKILKSVPQTDDKAYADAQKALKKDEEFTFSDDEINLLLPPSLKKKTELANDADKAQRAAELPPNNASEGESR